MNVHVLLLLLALICFVLDAMNVPTRGRVNLQSTGLALWVASLIL